MSVRQAFVVEVPRNTHRCSRLFNEGLLLAADVLQYVLNSINIVTSAPASKGVGVAPVFLALLP